MKRTYLISTMAVLAVVGCQVEKEQDVILRDGVVFTATVEEGFGDDTKTSLDSEGNVLWKQGDQVSIFAGSTINERYQVTDASDGKTAAALNKVGSPGFVAGTDIDHNVAFYPYASTAAIAKNGSSYVISEVALPSSQTYAAGSFGNGAFPMATVTNSTSDYNLKFKNVLGGLKLQLKGTATIASITVTGNNDEILCGAAEVTVSYGDIPSISLSDATAKTVTLDCGDGVTLNTVTATDFIIALPPMIMTGGFTVLVSDTDNASMEIKTTKSQTIPRSSLLKMPVVTYEGTATSDTPVPEMVDLGLSVKWATFNIGGSSPEEYGDYYAWGELAPYYMPGYSQSDSPVWKSGKTGYAWSSYKLCKGKYYNVTKYCPADQAIYWAGEGSPDGKLVLDPEDDVAHVKLGGSWRMPTDAEWTELRENCTWTWTDDYNGTGVAGRIVTAINNNSIFLPAAGGRYNTNLLFSGSIGTYWSSSIYPVDPYEAWYVSFGSIGIGGGNNTRVYGFSVRPVSDEGIIKVTGIEVSPAEAELTEGETLQLTATVSPVNANQQKVTWASSDGFVAAVDDSGLVTAVASGSVTITATTVDGGFTSTCSLTILPAPTPIPELVDLGLSVKWATFNVGASAPEEYGDYYAWGELAPYYMPGYSQSDSPVWKNGKSEGYVWPSYRWCNGSYNTLTKYCPTDKADYWAGEGSPDGKLVLDPEDDVAHVKLGSGWRMPTDAEWTELRESCTWTWTSNYNNTGIAGRIVTSNKPGYTDKSIFLPAAGIRLGSSLYDVGSYGYYWSSLSTGTPGVAWYVYVHSSSVLRVGYVRYDGLSVRPVSDEGIIKVTGIELSPTEAERTVGETLQLTATVSPSNANQQKVKWSSSDEAIATVDDSGLVTAVSSGSVTITATTVDGGFIATCSLTVLSASTPTPVPEMVDLGLSVKWATFNVGASSPEEYGDYYAWGEVEPYYEPGYAQSDSPVWKNGKSEGYDWPSYGWCNGSYTTLTKYCPLSQTGYWDGVGSPDNKVTLDLEDDVAHAKWGGTWRMPTDAEWTELRENCTWVWTNNYNETGVKGIIVTAANNSSIFLPAAGHRFKMIPNDDESSYGYYWSSSINADNPNRAWRIYFTSLIYRDGYGRVSGQSIRPVSE